MLRRDIMSGCPASSSCGCNPFLLPLPMGYTIQCCPGTGNSTCGTPGTCSPPCSCDEVQVVVPQIPPPGGNCGTGVVTTGGNAVCANTQQKFSVKPSWAPTSSGGCGCGGHGKGGGSCGCGGQCGGGGSCGCGGGSKTTCGSAGCT